MKNSSRNNAALGPFTSAQRTTIAPEPSSPPIAVGIVARVSKSETPSVG